MWFSARKPQEAARRRRSGGGGRTTQGGRMSSDILIVDDEADIRELVSRHPRGRGQPDAHGRHLATRRSPRSNRGGPHLVFLDIWLQGSRLDGLQLLEIVKQQHPDLPVVMISGHGNIETAVSAIKAGAYDFIEKPFKADRLVLVADRALEASRLKREVKRSARPVRPGEPDRRPFAGRQPAPRRRIERVAPTNSPRADLRPAGLRQGARGAHHPRAVGARQRALRRHQRGDDHAGATWRTSCSASRRRGRAPAASARSRRPMAAPSSSTRSPTCRARPRPILRVLVDQNFQRVGGTTRVQVDVRVISSTVARPRRRDRRRALPRGPVPPPQRRAGPGAGAVRAARGRARARSTIFMDQISASTGLPKRRIADDAMAVLQAHDWPGNVRQLRNNVERLMILTPATRTPRSRPRCCRPRSARSCRRRRTGQGARSSCRMAAARGPRDLRARVSRRPDRPLLAATSRAPRSSSAWSARRCTGS